MTPCPSSLVVAYGAAAGPLQTGLYDGAFEHPRLIRRSGWAPAFPHSEVLEDTLLVWRFNGGEPAALCRIYEKYRAPLLKVASVLLDDRSGVEDVLHDVFVDFAQATGRFRLTGSLKGYLPICVANRSRDRNRAARRHPAVALEPTTATADPGGDPERTAERTCRTICSTFASQPTRSASRSRCRFQTRPSARWRILPMGSRPTA